MPNELIIHLQGNDLAQIQHLQAYLHPYIEGSIAEPLRPTHVTPEQIAFSTPDSGTYLLALSYQLGEQTFSSHFFQLDLPDTSLIDVALSHQGLQFMRMGFFDDLGEFIDMLIYEGEKPWLTTLVEEPQTSLQLATFLAQSAEPFEPIGFRQQLQTLLPDLSVAYPGMLRLWPYQLRILVKYLAKTTAEWKACLFQLIRNNLILIDDESCLEQLTDAIELAQQQERVAFLLDLMEWDVDRQAWVNYPQFLAELKAHGVIKK